MEEVFQNKVRDLECWCCVDQHQCDVDSGDVDHRNSQDERILYFHVQVSDKEEKMRLSEEEETEKMVRKDSDNNFYSPPSTEARKWTWQH